MTSGVEALRALLEKATPGPWLAFDNRDLNDAWWIGREKFVTHAECRAGSDDEPDRAEHDAALIVAMRNALPALLEERDAMLKALEPFAEAAEDLDERDEDRGNIWEAPVAMNITCGNLRTARTIYQAAQPKAGGGE